MKNKVVIVTGGADGIGAACVELFLKKKAYVVALDKNSFLLIKLYNKHKSEYADKLLTLVCDVSNYSDLDKSIQHILYNFKRIDCVINNAGIHPPVTTIDQFSIKDFEKVLSVNLISNYALCQLTSAELIKNKGTIIFISSLVALIGQNKAAAYCASKAGQIGLMKSLAIEFSPHVRVNAVAPSNVFTCAMENWLNTFENPYLEKQKIENVQKLKRMAEPCEIANIVYFLASKKSSFITGQTIEADGGACLDYY